MKMISAQVSLYPLRQKEIEPRIREAVDIFRECGLKTRMGEINTLVWGEEEVLFSAMREAFHQAAESGDTVMVIILSNACPTPKEV